MALLLRNVRRGVFVAGWVMALIRRRASPQPSAFSHQFLASDRHLNRPQQIGATPDI